ncbi:hypothetical protein [Nostoc favosum]|uniref:Uncharacterized protein n=1 Tax=Nostoc favosum CHAB5714 TaxID=2780399 RepID=A0ABS8IAJ9_9NOSO|nr:hypothetical protein [Nostoc favosum]MCC5601095.1 hypothetical protein [Nostoc favosum CHAB5714]
MPAALGRSRKALPEYLPNPPVACVIADADQIVPQGKDIQKHQPSIILRLVRWLFTHLL